MILMAESTAVETASLSYEEARDELVQVVNRLEQGGATLEDSLQLWERGEALAARCEDWLIGARKRLEAARAGAVGDDTTAEGDGTASAESATPANGSTH